MNIRPPLAAQGAGARWTGGTFPLGRRASSAAPPQSDGWEDRCSQGAPGCPAQAWGRPSDPKAPNCPSPHLDSPSMAPEYFK